MLGKARGSKKANNFLNEEVKKTGVNYDLPVMLGHTGISDELLQEYIAASRELWEDRLDRLSIVQIGCVVGTHAGPGGVAAAYFDE